MSLPNSVREWAIFRFLQSRQRAYQLCFTTPAGQMVLADLAKFCRATTTCYDPDPRKHAALEGRRDVFLRIANHMNLTPEQLYALVEKAPAPTVETR